MVSWKKLMCVVFVCFYLGFMVCLANAAQQAPEPETVKTKAELKREKKARDAEKIKARREAAAKAKREAAEKAKAKRKERARLAVLDAEAKKEAKAEIEKAKKEKKARLAALDAKAENYAQRKKQIEAEYKEKIAKINLKFARRKEKLKDGILPVEVLEAPVTAVTISAYDPDQKKMEKGFLSTTAVREWSPIEVGQVANQKELDDFVNLLNLNPDRYVSATVTKRIEPYSLAVEYNIYEANPWHFFYRVDNSGTKDRQWTPRSDIINTNLLGVDDTFRVTYQAPWMWESDWGEHYLLYGSYDFPICGPRLRLNVYGGYSEYDIAAEGLGFVGNGSFIGGKLRYNAFQTNGWFFDVTTSLSHERSKVTSSLAALFPGFSESDVEYQLWGIGFDIHKRDDMSQSSLTFERVQSVGGSKEAHFKAARTNTDDDFTIYTVTAAHSQFLKPDKVEKISGTFRYIYPTARLVPARMTTFGGMYTVRGYDEYDIVADGGLLASAQYEFDLVKYDESKQTPGVKRMQQKKGGKPFIRKLAPLAFVDYGRARTRNTVATEKGDQTLVSIGTGVLVELGDNFSGQVYYGLPLTGTGNTNKGQGRINVGLMLRW